MTEKTKSTNLQSFFEATLDVDRLKIIAVLSHEPASVLDLAEKFEQNPSVVLRHLGVLEDANLVKSFNQEGRTFYQFNSKNLDVMAHQRFSVSKNQIDFSSFDLSENQQAIIKHYLRSDGSLKLIPSQSKKIIAILEYISQAFKFDKDYSEKEVNAKLEYYHPDTAILRRYLVDYRYLGRESNGSRYWRVKNQ
jgi:predicted transcriptional regulator